MMLRDWLRELYSNGQVPFTMAAAAAGVQAHLSIVRIFEAVVIAGVTAVASGYVTGRVLEERLSAIARDVEKIERRVERHDEDLRTTREMVLDRRSPARRLGD